MSPKDFDPDLVRGADLAYEPQRLELIGQISLDWNACEQALEWVIWRLIGVDYLVGECITTDLNNVTRQTLVINLLKRFHDEAPNLDRYMSIMSLFDECRIARNDAVHASIMAGPDDYLALSRTMKARTGKLRMRAAHKEVLELEMIAAAIGWLLEELLRFSDALDGEPFPSRDKDLLPVYVELLERLRHSRQSHDFPPQSSEA